MIDFSVVFGCFNIDKELLKIDDGVVVEFFGEDIFVVDNMLVVFFVWKNWGGSMIYVLKLEG